MSRGDRVELRGFGAFSVKKRDARVGRNPRTGDHVEVAEKFVPFFKTGKELRERLNERIPPDPKPKRRDPGLAGNHGLPIRNARQDMRNFLKSWSLRRWP